MKDLECPHCLKLINYDGDEEDFSQDSEHEFVCSECDETFLATVYWARCFTGERKPEPKEAK